jgi:hypothetical protein
MVMVSDSVNQLDRVAVSVACREVVLLRVALVLGVIESV